MCSIISINKNNKIINLYDQALLPGGKSDFNELLLSWLPLVPSSLPVSLTEFPPTPPKKKTNEKLRKDPGSGPESLCFMVVYTAAYKGQTTQQIPTSFSVFVCKMSTSKEMEPSLVLSMLSQHARFSVSLALWTSVLCPSPHILLY